MNKHKQKILTEIKEFGECSHGLPEFQNFISQKLDEYCKEVLKEVLPEEAATAETFGANTEEFGNGLIGGWNACKDKIRQSLKSKFNVDLIKVLNK